MLKVPGIISTSRICSIAALVLLSAGCAAAAPISYLIGVDTSSLPAPFQGFLDFQFNPGGNQTPPQAAVATVSNFTATGGALVGDPMLAGNATGSLQPGPVTLMNGTPFNDFFQQFNFGSFFSFVLELTGQALNTPDPGASASGSTFGLTLLDSTGLRAILTSGTPLGPIVTVDVNPNTTTTLSPFLNGTGPSVVTLEEVPEPGSMLLLAFGTTGLIFLRKILR